MPEERALLKNVAGMLAVVLVAACGAESARYTIGGTVSGLSGAGLVLANNGSSTVAVSANGAFTFSAGVENGGMYAVTVQGFPEGQACSVANGTGTVNAAAVTNIAVTCSAATPLTLTSISPASGSTNVARNVAPALTFSAPLGSPNPAIISLQGPSGTAAVTASTAGNTLTVTPGRKLLPLGTYTLTAMGVRGSNGEQQTATATTSFTTRDAAWQANEQLITDFPGSGFLTTIGMNSKGDAVAMWLQNMDLWTSPYTPAAGWGPAERVQFNAPGLPGIVMDPEGNAIGLWEIVDPYRCDNEDGCAHHTLRVRRYTKKDGWGPYKTISARETDSYLNPDIAINSNGDAVVVWNEYHDTQTRIWSVRFTADDGWTKPAAISAGAESAFDPHVVLDEAGNALVVWDQFDNGRDSVWANRYTTGGGWGTAALIESDTAGHNGLTELVMDSHGNAMAVWRHFLNMESDIWANRFTPGGGWGTAGPIGSGPGAGAFGVKVGSDANGNVIVIWEQPDPLTADTTDRAILASRYAANAGWSPPVTIGNNRATDQRNPLLAVDPGGNALAVWQEYDGIRFNSWSDRYTLTGGWAGPMLVENYDAGSVFITFLEMDAGGDALALFVEFTGTNARNYTRRFE